MTKQLCPASVNRLAMVAPESPDPTIKKLGIRYHMFVGFGEGVWYDAWFYIELP